MKEKFISGKTHGHWFGSGLILLAIMLNLSLTAQVSPSLRKYIQDSVVQADGKIIYGILVPGSPPPKVLMPPASPTESAVMLDNVPAFDWCFGCSATSAAMAAGYYDNHSFVNMYAGPTNGGVCPQDNSSWPHVWINGEYRAQCPLSATRDGVDGRTTRGHVDDYWIAYGNAGPDPWITNGWTEHSWGECTADYMGTSQSTFESSDGSTWFYSYNNGTPLYDYTGCEPGRIDGCHGIREFFESRGYDVEQNYTQYIYGYDGNTQGFTLAQFRDMIDAGKPVLIHVEGHTMLGVGYEPGNSEIIYIHDTWDYNNHQMTWGGVYSGMQHYSVTVAELEPLSSVSIYTNVPGQTFCDDGSITEVTTPIIVTGLDETHEIDLLLDYDTSKLTYSSIGMQNAVFDGNPISVSDDSGSLTISWNSIAGSAVITNDTLLTLVFTKKAEGELEFSWDASSAYRDDDGDDLTASFSAESSYLIENPEITAVTPTQISCPGSDNGEIEITATAYTLLNYSIDNGANWVYNQSTFTSLTAANYNVVVSDTFGCQDVWANNPITITEPTSITKDTIIAQNVSCNGVGDASITIECSGGTGSLVYSIDNGATWDAGTGIFDNLTPGDYNLKAKDENDCMWTYDNNPLTITQPDELLITNVIPVDVQGCYGDETGSVSISAGGGTAPYQYSIDNGTNWQSNADFVDLAAGDYNLVVKDANNCQEIYAANPIVISQPDELIINDLTFTKESATGAGDATIIIDAAGGTGTLSYSVDNGVTWEQNGGSFTTLNGGTYNVQVKDVNGCTKIYASNPVIINDPHFTKIWSGGAFNPMTITVSSAAIDGLLMQAGDEVGIFDGDNCVGAAVLIEAVDSLDNNTYLYVTCSADDPNDPGIDGFVAGNDVEYRLWDDVLQEEFTVVDAEYPYAPTFAFEVFTQNETSVVYLNGIPRILTWIENTAECMNDTLYVPVIARGMHEMDSAWIYVDYDTSLFEFSAVENFHPDLYNVYYGLDDETIEIGMGADNLEFTEEKMFDIVLVNKPNQTGIDTLKISGTYSHQTGGSYTIESEFIDGTAQVRVLPSISDVGLTNITGCFGNTNGEIDITATAETDDIYYSIDNGTNWDMNQNAFDNLAAGSYEIMVQDTFACQQVWENNPVELTEPDELLINDVVSVDVSGCFGNTNASITITAAGGTGDLMFSIDNGTNWQAGFAFENLAAGNYNVIVKDVNNCQTLWANNPVVIDQPEEVIISSAVHTDITGCYGDSTATITVVATGGTGNLMYSIDSMQNWYANNGQFDELVGGNYYVFVKDANDCAAEYAANPIVIDQPDEVLITDMDVQDVTGCYGNTNGSITITAEGGTGQLEYTIDNGANWQTDAAFAGLAAGNYNAWVRDANACMLEYANNPIVITQPEGIVINEVFQENVSCNGAGDAWINIDATGGSGDLMFTIDNGGNWQEDSLFIDLTPGLYFIKVKDANNCEMAYANNPVIITQPSPLFISDVEVTDVNCHGYFEGQIEITATGGTPDYQYSIDDGANWMQNSVFADLAAGSYNVWIKDEHDCTAEYLGNPVLIAEPDTLIITNLDLTNISGCYGNANGAVTITATGGTLSYEYSLDYTNWQADATFSNLAAGMHTVWVRDVNFCQDSTSFTLTEPEEVVVTDLTPTLPSCYGSNNGELLISADGGTGVYEYSVDNGATWSVDPHFVDLGPDAYYILVKDENDCQAAYGANPYYLPQPDSINITTVYPSNPNCYGAADGFIALGASGGTGALYYSIDSMNTWTQAVNFDNLPAGDYYVFVKDENDCVTEFYGNPVILSDPDEVLVSSVEKQDIACYGAENGSISITAQGGTGSLYYSIDGGAEWSDNGLFTSLSAGSYELWVKDDNDCSNAYANNPVTIEEADEILITIMEVTDVSCYGSNDGLIKLSAVGGTDTLWYSIDNGASWSLNDEFTGLGGGSYTVKVKDVAGCVVDYQNNPVIIAEPDAIDIVSVTGVDPLCNNEENGSIAIDAAGGQGALLFSIDDGANWQDNNGIFQNLAAGTYYIAVKDENDCRMDLDDPVVLNNPDALNFAAVSFEAPSCYENEDGFISIEANGGTGDIMYSVDNGSNWSESPNFTGLGNGEYILMIKDANDCELAYASNPIILNTEAINIADVISQDASCATCPDGQIIITANSGTGALEYSVDGGQNWQSAPAFTDLMPGEYNVAVRDENNCVMEYDQNPVLVEFTIGVDELAAEAFSAELYPNPSNKHFWLKMNGVQEKYTVSLNDISGQLIFNEEYQAEKAAVIKEFNLKQLPAGTYFMHIQSGTHTEVLKLIFK